MVVLVKIVDIELTIEDVSNYWKKPAIDITDRQGQDIRVVSNYGDVGIDRQSLVLYVPHVDIADISRAGTAEAIAYSILEVARQMKEIINER